MGFAEWVGIVAIIFSGFAFIFSWKWASDSNRNLEEIRKVADRINDSVDGKTKEIERKVEERTKDMERIFEDRVKEMIRIVEDRTRNIERIVDDRSKTLELKVEERLSDLIKRAAPSIEDKAMGDFMSQAGPELFKSLMGNPDFLKQIMNDKK
jgi:hypothetical protein